MKGQCIEKRRQQQPVRKIRRKDGKREQDTENKNPRPKEYKAAAIFERSSVISSLILRELFADVTRVWKLKYLAEKCVPFNEND